MHTCTHTCTCLHTQTHTHTTAATPKHVPVKDISPSNIQEEKKSDVISGVTILAPAIDHAPRL